MELTTAKYKQTEVGLIPEDWEMFKLGDIVDQNRHIRYGVVQPGKYTQNGCYMLRSQDYSKGWKSKDTMHRVNAIVESQYKGTKLKCGDLVITIVGAGIAQVVEVPKIIEGTLLSRSTARIAVDKEKANSRLILHFLSSSLGREQVLFGIKEGAQPVVSANDVGNCLIPLPPTLTEQKAIATALSDVDDLISNLDKLISKKKAIKQGTMQQLLTPPHKGGKRLAGFTEDWMNSTMINCLDIPATYGIVKAGDFQANGVKMVRGGDIKLGKLLINEMPFVSKEKSSEFSRTILKKDDVLISLVGYPGEAAKVPEELAGNNISRAVGLLRLNKTIFPDFLVQFLNSTRGRKLVLGPSAGSAQLVVNLDALNKLKLNFPSKVEQKSISKILCDMDLEIEQLEIKKAKYQDIKQGMMQELLTGKTRLV